MTVVSIVEFTKRNQAQSTQLAKVGNRESKTSDAHVLSPARHAPESKRQKESEVKESAGRSPNRED